MAYVAKQPRYATAKVLTAMKEAGYTTVTDLVLHGIVWTADAIDVSGASVVVIVQAGRDGIMNAYTDDC